MGLFKKYKTYEDILPGFLMEKETINQHKSFSAYNCHTKIFLEWLKDNGLAEQPIKKITSENITSFFYFLGKEKGLDRTTCEKYYLDIRQVFKLAQKLGELETIPFDFVVLPRKKKDQGAEMIQSYHLKPLLLNIREKDPQLFLACMIQYYCFIRPGKELRLLKIGDIDLEKGLITVRQENAKNKKKQIVTIPSQLIEICKEYEIDKVDNNLFVFGKNKQFGAIPISINMLRYRFNKFRESMDLPKEYKLYSMKHTGASNLHLSGISMRELMDQLRHTKLEATQHYLKRHCGIVNDRIRDNFPSPI